MLTGIVSSGCFPGRVTVQVRDGETFEKLMQDVSIGDEVIFDCWKIASDYNVAG